MDTYQRVIKLILYIAPMILTIAFHRNMRKNRRKIGGGTEELFSVIFDVLTFTFVGFTVLDLDVTGWFLRLLQQHFSLFCVITLVIAMLNPVLRIRDLCREERSGKFGFWVRESLSYNLLGWLAGIALSAFVLFLTASGSVEAHFLGADLDNDFLAVILYCAISVPFFFYVDDLSRRGEEESADPAAEMPAPENAPEAAAADAPARGGKLRVWWDSEARWQTANALWLACIALIAVMNVLFIFKTRPVYSDGWHYTVMILCCDLFFLRMTHSGEQTDNDLTMRFVFLLLLAVEAVYLLAALALSGFCRDMAAALIVTVAMAALVGGLLLAGKKKRTQVSGEKLRPQALIPYLVPAVVILSYLVLRWGSQLF